MKRLVVITIISVNLILNSVSKMTWAPTHEEKDFKKDKIAAQRWGQEQFNDWHGKLSENETTALMSYAFPHNAGKFNKFIELTNGELDQIAQLPEGYSENRAQKYTATIRNIDTALEKIKTKNSLIVYKEVDEEQFSQVRPLRNHNEIDKNYFDHIKNQFIDRIFMQNSFLNTTLIEHDDNYANRTNFGSLGYPILMKIHIPSGTHAGFLDPALSSPSNKDFLDNKLLLLIKRGYHFKYDKFSIVKTGRRERLKVDVSLMWRGWQ